MNRTDQRHCFDIEKECQAFKYSSPMADGSTGTCSCPCEGCCVARATEANKGPSMDSMLGGLLGSFGQVAAATLVRAQLERIADSMELEVLLEGCLNDPGNAQQARLVEARRFLRDKIITRVEREALAEAGRAATVSPMPGSDPRGMCPGGCGRKAIDGKRTCGDARCGRTTP